MAQVQELQDVSDFDEMLDASYDQPIALLKHSIACPLSARGQREFVGLNEDGDPPLYAVVVQYARDVSRYVAERLGVRHETPQVLVIRNGEAVYHASHFEVSADAVREAVRHARGWAS